ncbi:hypothetical protein ACFFKC_16100 [Pseudoduganella danionis]|uniref:Pilus assembly protein PilM n=1 Tax=Pseudoduganella danionis TaxID=1890295 RepID=A0ABW9SML5_9BURK|nr:hypothetical protein [Pseudoduganella danionis]MTW33413.1 hypothetical protein [Pseudoduganella danionis]
MRRAWGQSLRIGVAAQGVSLLRESRWRKAGVEVLAQHVCSAAVAHPYDGLAQGLRALLGGHQLAGWPVRFVLADELVRLWRVEPPAGAARLADLQASAGLRFQSLYGEAPAGWQISADWNAAAPFWAAAMPRELLEVLQLQAQEHGLRIVSIEPQMIAVLNRWRRALRPGAWFAAVHDGVLSIAALEPDASAVRAIRVLPMPSAQNADQLWLGQVLQREALRLDMAAPQLLQVCGSAPKLWHGPVSHAEHIPCAVLDQAQQGARCAMSVLAQLALSGCAQ